jgi:6-phosphofructokinase
MSGASNLIERGVKCVGVPKTIDNDLMHTEWTFGFTTATQTATECLDRIHSTASSHHRVMLVELMGRNAGWLTLHAGIASGADVILIPEIALRPRHHLRPLCPAEQARQVASRSSPSPKAPRRPAASRSSIRSWSTTAPIRSASAA